MCLVVSYPFAYYLATRTGRTRALLLVLVMIPFWSNLLVRTYAWRFLLSSDGPFTRLLVGLGFENAQLLFTPWAVLIGLVYGYLPFMILPLYASIERLDHSLVEAARDLYASGWQAFWKVTWPLTRPGVIAGSILVFIPSFGAYVTPEILGGRGSTMLGSYIARQFIGTASDWPFGSALSVAILLVMMVAAMAYFRSGGKTCERATMSVLEAPGAAADVAEDSLARPKRSVDRLLAGNAWLVFAFLYLPILVLIVYSFNDNQRVGIWGGFSTRWYGAMFSNVRVMDALWTSILVAVLSTVIATVLGTAAALSMERYRYRGQRAYDGLLYLPVIIPDITMAVMLLLFFVQAFDLIWLATGVQLSRGVGTITLSHVAFNISFVALVVRARLSGLDGALEEAAADLYASRWQAFRRVTLPLIAPGVAGGALLALTLSLDDVVIAEFVSGAGSTTLPVYVFGALRRGVTPLINAVSVLMLAGSIVLVLLSLAISSRRRDA
jgi:spermidine/putrescine transport system permease protein